MRIEMSAPRPLPDVNDGLTASFWAASRERQLVVQHCTACGEYRWPPLPSCPNCLERPGEWAEVAPTGTIWTFAVYRRALHPAFAGEIPYVVAVIELEHGLHMTGNVVNKPEDVAIGAPVKAVFDAVTPEVTLVKWALAD
jgi:hypothetical protein